MATIDSNYRTNESMGKMFMHSCLGKLVILIAVIIVLLIIAMMTKPSEQEMQAEMADNIMQCIEANDSIEGDKIDDYVNNIGNVFTTTDTTQVNKDLREAFRQLNKVEIYNHLFYRTAYILNNLHPEGTRAGVGIFGLVIPTVTYKDFLLRVGPMHKGYDQKLIRTTVPDTDLGTNPNIQEFHYKRNPDD